MICSMKRFTVQMDDELYSALETRAAQLRRPVSWVAREAMVAGLVAWYNMERGRVMMGEAPKPERAAPDELTEATPRPPAPRVAPAFVESRVERDEDGWPQGPQEPPPSPKQAKLDALRHALAPSEPGPEGEPASPELDEDAPLTEDGRYVEQDDEVPPWE